MLLMIDQGHRGAWSQGRCDQCQTVDFRSVRAGDVDYSCDQDEATPKHLVPLPPQAVKLLQELEKITGAGKYLFPNHRRPDDVMSATTINRALEHMGTRPGM